MKAIVAVSLLWLCSIAWAVGLEPTDFTLVEPTGSWFEPDFSGYSSFSMVTGGGKTLASGLTVGTMTFSLHPDWDVSLDVGYGRIYDFHGFSCGHVLGGLDIRWKPSSDFTLQLHCSGAIPDSSLTGF